MPHALTIYLVRHEEAEPGIDIPDEYRALTAKGRARMRETAKLVMNHARIDLFYTSPLVRAVQTAEILIGAFASSVPMLAVELIASPPTMAALVDLIDRTPDGVRGLAIVGHEPTLGELAAELLGGGMRLSSFKKGSVLALDYDRKAGRAVFRWLILGKGPSIIDQLTA